MMERTRPYEGLAVEDVRLQRRTPTLVNITVESFNVPTFQVYEAVKQGRPPWPQGPSNLSHPAFRDISSSCTVRDREKRPSSKVLLKTVQVLNIPAEQAQGACAVVRKPSVESVRSIPSPPPPPPVPHLVPAKPKTMPENDTSAETSPIKEQPLRRTFSVTKRELVTQKERLRRTQPAGKPCPAGESRDLTSVMKKAIFQRRDSVWRDQGQTTASSSHDEQSPCESPW